MKLRQIITGVNAGGAEMMLFNLLTALDRRSYQVEVVSLTDVGTVGERIRALGIPVRALGMRRGTPNPLGVARLARWLRRDPPDLVHSWMYHANLVAALAARLAGVRRVVWGLHHASLDRRVNKLLTLGTSRACAGLSHWIPERIVCCSETARQLHEQAGYRAERMTVIPNGFDLARFRPDREARRKLRAELGLAETDVLIGLASRWDPLKDHRNFLSAAGALAGRLSQARFLLCGDGITPSNPALLQAIEAEGLAGRVSLLGHREDMPQVLAALDVAVSSSAAEAFPCAIGEAMACGVPCVVTDAGDSAYLVGPAGRVVPTRNPAALAEALEQVARAEPGERARWGLQARQRVQDLFSLEAVTRRYEGLYQDTGQAAGGGGSIS